MLSASLVNYCAFFIEYQIYNLNTANESSEMITGTYRVGFTQNGLYSTDNSTLLMFNGPDSSPVSGSNLFPQTILSSSLNNIGTNIQVKFVNNTFPPQPRWISYTYRLIKRTAIA